ETRYKDTSEAFDSGVDGLTADTSSPSQVSSLLWFPGACRAQSSGAIHQTTSDAVRQNIYENFMRELETGTGTGGGDRRDPSTGTEDDGSSSESAEGSVEELDLLFAKEQGVVRRAGWLSFKPLITLHKDRKLELVTRRKWKHYWVTLKGCTLLFYETYGKSSTEQDLSPRYALLAEDSVVQAVPEHPKRENVFCLSNSYGDVYLFQASNQTDLENWVTAIHSASASLLAKRQGKEDTVRLLRNQARTLLQKIDMDGKMKKMAELQLTVVSDPKNRKAIENQEWPLEMSLPDYHQAACSRFQWGCRAPTGHHFDVPLYPHTRVCSNQCQQTLFEQWEQNLERFNMDLFRMRCYLASLQGGELPNPKSLLAIASRPTKTTLGRLGVFSVSSFHALICSRDEATARRRSLSVTCRQRKRSLFSSLKGLDNLTKRGREKRPSVVQVNPYSLHLTECSLSSFAPSHLSHHLLCDIYVYAFVHVRQHLGIHPLRCYYSVELPLPGLMRLSYFLLCGRPSLRPGDEILVLNGRCVSPLDLTLIQTLFAEQSLDLRLRRDGQTQPAQALDYTGPPNKCSQEVRSKHHRAKSSSDVCAAADDGESLRIGLENDLSHCAHRLVQHSKDQSPAHALCSLLAMCWFWSSSSEAEEEDLNLGSALLSLGRLVKDKLACLADNVSACLSCQRGSKQAVIIGQWHKDRKVLYHNCDQIHHGFVKMC
ncbi:hypothetical protein GOODEAATRI_000168, partial [Goodea atripinnis]